MLHQGISMWPLSPFKSIAPLEGLGWSAFHEALFKEHNNKTQAFPGFTTEMVSLQH